MRKSLTKNTVCPVMYADSGETKYDTRFATSSGFPIRPTAVFWISYDGTRCEDEKPEVRLNSGLTVSLRAFTLASSKPRVWSLWNLSPLYWFCCLLRLTQLGFNHT